MRTYWLISKNNHNAPQAITVFNDITPDLISNVETENSSANSGIIYPHPFNSNSLCPMKQQQLIQQQQQRLRYNRNLPCNCQTKCIYNRRSDDNVNTTDLPINRSSNSHLCVCRLKASISHGVQRGPRSAPIITFRL